MWLSFSLCVVGYTYMHKILLEQAENPLEYNWSIGWAETFEEYQNEQVKATEAEE